MHLYTLAASAAHEHSTTESEILAFATESLRVCPAQLFSAPNQWGVCLITASNRQSKRSSSSALSYWVVFPWLWHDAVNRMPHAAAPRPIIDHTDLQQLTQQYVRHPEQLTHVNRFLELATSVGSSKSACSIEFAREIAAVTGWVIGPKLRSTRDATRYLPTFVINHSDRERVLSQDEPEPTPLQVHPLSPETPPAVPSHPVSDPPECPNLVFRSSEGPVPFVCSCELCFPSLLPTLPLTALKQDGQASLASWRMGASSVEALTLPPTPAAPSTGREAPNAATASH